MTNGKGPGFTDAARLYAENAKLVEAMEKALRSSIAEVLEAARGEAERVVQQQMAEPGRGIQRKLGSKSEEARSPWVIWRFCASDDDPQDGPYLWFYCAEPEIVVPGSLEVTVSGGKASKPERLRYLSVKSELGLIARAGEDGGLFTFDVACGGADPAGEIAAAIAPVFVALRRVERSLGRS